MLVSTNFCLGDPGRIAAQVISGIGFLGAGIILHYEDKIYGLTTAACIWVTAIIGLAVGNEMYVNSIIVTLLLIIIMRRLIEDIVATVLMFTLMPFLWIYVIYKSI